MDSIGCITWFYCVLLPGSVGFIARPIVRWGPRLVFPKVGQGISQHRGRGVLLVSGQVDDMFLGFQGGGGGGSNGWKGY